MSAPDFDWANDECVVLHRQPAIAVYPNNMSTITIRQERDWYEEDDSIIITASLDGAEAIAQAILREVEAVRRDLRETAQQGPKDSTAAERQRRRRKQLNAQSDVTAPVTADVTAPNRDSHRDVTRDTGDVTLFGVREAGVPAERAAA